MRETKLFQLMDELEKELQRIVNKSKGKIVEIEIGIKAKTPVNKPVKSLLTNL